MNTTTILLAGYLVLAVSGIALALLGCAVNAANPIGAIMQRPIGRWFVLLLWFWTGWHFFAR